jgi:hypothetical protein
LRSPPQFTETLRNRSGVGPAVLSANSAECLAAGETKSKQFLKNFETFGPKGALVL